MGCFHHCYIICFIRAFQLQYYLKSLGVILSLEVCRYHLFTNTFDTSTLGEIINQYQFQYQYHNRLCLLV